MLFSDEQADLGAASRRYHEAGAPAGWRDSCVLPYATAHPWEDFAETWTTHDPHTLDTLETARAFGIRVDPVVANDPTLTTKMDFDPLRGR